MTMSSKRYQELEVWKKGMDLVVECYRVTEGFPKNEVYGLGSQLQRAAVSIPANIAEGQGRQHPKEFLHFLSIVYGSLAELETHLHISERLHYIDSKLLEQLTTKSGEIGRMINGLRKALREKS